MKRIAPVSMGGISLASHYSQYPCLKRALHFGMGTQSAYSIKDYKTDLTLQPYDWTATGPNAAVTQVASDSIQHNKNLVTGTWPQHGTNESIFVVAGKFRNADSIFGFGDSTPNNMEVVIGMFDSRPFANYKGRGTDGLATEIDETVPSAGIDAFPRQMDPNEISLLAFIFRGTPGNYELELVATDDDTITSVRQNAHALQGIPDFPATYSLGRTYDAGAVPFPAGSWDELKAIRVYSFENGIPSDYQDALLYERSMLAVDRMDLWPLWRGKS